jgi:transcriptional regulator with XRE-family HTH domain
MKTLGDNIRFYRKQRGWSQEDLADRLDITMLAISNMERNITDVSYSRLKQLAEIFEITISELISLDKEPSEYLKLKTIIKRQEKEIIELQRKLLKAFERKKK